MEQGIFAVCRGEAMQGQTIMCRGKACFFAACNIDGKVIAGVTLSRGFSHCPGVKQCRGRRQCAGEKHVSLLLVVFTGRLMQERRGAGAFRNLQG